MTKDIKIAFGTDVDAGEVGVPRLLELFRRHDIRQTWFWPGHSIETNPCAV